jgi:hypothetical protein
MKQAFDSVKRLVESMSFILKQAGIRHEMPTGETDRIPLSKYNEMYDFLHKLYMSDEFQTAKKAKELVTDEIWANLEIVGEKSMIEYRNLKKYLPPVRDMWKPPFKFFGKHYAPKSDQLDEGATSTPSPDVRPEQTGTAKRGTRRGRNSVLFDQSQGISDERGAVGGPEGLGRQLGPGDPVTDLH